MLHDSALYKFTIYIDIDIIDDLTCLASENADSSLNWQS